MVVQKQLWPSFSKSAACSRCPLCSIPQHHHIQSDADAPRMPSRRDVIALFLQAAFLSAPNNNVQAVESGFERVEGSVHLQFKNDLDMQALADVSPVPESMPKLFLGKPAGVLLAYQGAQKSSSSSLGLLGCLVFGLLFLREKQTRAANHTSLEDVQVRIKQAETELCLQTRSSVVNKLEESQLENGNGRDTSQNEALQRHLVNLKCSIAEREKQIDLKKDVSELLKKQTSGLTASVKEIEKDCISLLGRVDKQLNSRHELEAELKKVVVDLQSKAKKITCLKASVETQEEANSEMVEKLIVMESSLEKFNKHVLDAERRLESLKNSLLMTGGSANSLAKELRFTGTRNEISEGELSELLRHLQFEQAAFVRHLAEQKEIINCKGEEVDTRSAELSNQQDGLERNLMFINQLTKQLDELMMAVSEQRITSEVSKKMLDTSQERLTMSQNELAALHEQLFHEQARSTALESDLENIDVFGSLSKMSLEVEDQINTQKDTLERLEKELHVTNQALSESNVQVFALQDTMQSLLSEQTLLQRDLARLNEERQAASQALKKEKRAAAYAKKQLTLSKEIIAQENRAMEEIGDEFEKARRLIEDFKEQILTKTAELERVTETAPHLTDDCLQSKSALNEEYSLQVSDEALTSVGKPICRRNTAPKMQKSFKKSSVQPTQ